MRFLEVSVIGRVNVQEQVEDVTYLTCCVKHGPLLMVRRSVNLFMCSFFDFPTENSAGNHLEA